MTRAKQRTIDLETYEGFLQNPHYQYPTINQLNQIIHMHGFTKLHRRPKRVLIDALSMMDLLIPLRSTLKERVSSSYASLPIEQVKEDLDILEWQECPVRSVETVKQPQQEVQRRYQKLAGGNLLPTRLGHTKRVSEMAMGFGNTTKKPRSKRKRGSLLKAGCVTSKTDANLSAIAAASMPSPPVFANLGFSIPSMDGAWYRLETIRTQRTLGFH
ncbi:uncharacterized protein LOC122060124 [Macadamia integrifolia]|uniref:uncharacterized protein LOC122060124 n=1 Tax=Macadamia integrifolia TaxID=60698 RepID=UPI001C50225F|nr:uncharacterized protein LOC122060124 [Macadamia integrifolia]